MFRTSWSRAIRTDKDYVCFSCLVKQYRTSAARRLLRAPFPGVRKVPARDPALNSQRPPRAEFSGVRKVSARPSAPNNTLHPLHKHNGVGQTTSLSNGRGASHDVVDSLVHKAGLTTTTKHRKKAKKGSGTSTTAVRQVKEPKKGPAGGLVEHVEPEEVQRLAGLAVLFAKDRSTQAAKEAKAKELSSGHEGVEHGADATAETTDGGEGTAAAEGSKSSMKRRKKAAAKASDISEGETGAKKKTKAAATKKGPKALKKKAAKLAENSLRASKESAPKPASKVPRPRNSTQAAAQRGKPLLRYLSSERPDSELEPGEAPSYLRNVLTRRPETDVRRLDIDALEVKALEAPGEQPLVPSLSYGLERVLFNPGVYQLQDPRTRVFNFDPYLAKIMPVSEFDFNALKQFVTSSRDEALQSMAAKHGKKYVGSSSSMTGALAHFHFLLSQWRPIDTSMLSQGFPERLKSFTSMQRIPSAIFLRQRDGAYAIDADKAYDSANIFSMLGKSMEKLLTLSTEDFERYRRSNSGQIGEEERNAPESFHYCTMGDLLMRSQLDAHDPRLPGTGMFDLKTRAVVSVRMDSQNYQSGTGYQIKERFGSYESFEREYFDMIRAAFLKYSLQVRMGRMDGIFVAFHNTERIFGFQYISLSEMDATLHGSSDTTLGDQEFKISLELFNKVLDRATAKFPNRSLRLHFETRDSQTPFMYIFAEPVTEEQITDIQNTNKLAVEEFERNILGLQENSSEDVEAEEETEEDSEKRQWEELQAKVEKEMEHDELFPGSRRSSGHEIHSEQIEGKDRTASTTDGETGASSAAPDEDEADDDEQANDEEEDEDDEDSDEEEDSDSDDEDSDSDSDSEDEEAEGEEEEEEEEGQGLKLTAAEEAAEEGVELEGQEADDAADPYSESAHFQPQAPEAQGDVATGEPHVTDLDSPQAVSSISETSTPPSDTLRAEPDAAWKDVEEHGDRPWLDRVDHEQSLLQKNIQGGGLLAMTLTLRNKVNNEYITRPAYLSSNDRWSVEYALTEIESESRAWSLYSACQLRRKKRFDETDDQDQYYRQLLAEMSKKGRKWRQEQDKLEKEFGQTVLGREGKASSSSSSPSSSSSSPV